MITKYRTWLGDVSKVEVERESVTCVWIKGMREAKLSEWKGYFNTFQEAKKHLVEYALRRLEKAKYDVAVAQRALVKAESLVEAK